MEHVGTVVLAAQRHLSSSVHHVLAISKQHFNSQTGPSACSLTNEQRRPCIVGTWNNSSLVASTVASQQRRSWVRILMDFACSSSAIVNVNVSVNWLCVWRPGLSPYDCWKSFTLWPMTTSPWPNVTTHADSNHVATMQHIHTAGIIKYSLNVNVHIRRARFFECGCDWLY